MLEWEFYIFNATTALLWLFQNCDHSMLIGLIILGAVCVLAGSLVLVVRLVSSILYIPPSIIHCLFDFVKYAVSSEVSSRPSQSFSSVNNLLQSSSSLLQRLSLERDAALARLRSLDRRLSLPQSLALHPAQWTQLESDRPAVPAIEADPSSPIVVNDDDNVTSSSPIFLRPPSPRRSRRLQHRARVRNCYCSS